MSTTKLKKLTITTKLKKVDNPTRHKIGKVDYSKGKGINIKDKNALHVYDNDFADGRSWTDRILCGQVS